MDVLNPPKSYIDYRCFIHELSGPALVNAQERFYRKQSELKGEICTFFNELIKGRENRLLPFERIEIREQDGKKHGQVNRMMIYDIEYWIENGRIRQRKIYVAEQGQLSRSEAQQIDHKARAAGEEEVPF